MRCIHRLLLALIFGLSLAAPPAHAEVTLTGRHIYVLFPGVDSLWGSYLFVVNNSGSAPERHTFPVMLPTETVDFQGQENIAPEDLKLGADGKLTIDKEFPPGESMVNVGFKITAAQGKAKFTVTPLFPVEALSLFVWEDTLDVMGENLQAREGVPFSGRNYDTYTLSGATVGQSFSAEITRVPEGRGRLQIIGGSLLGILILGGFALAYFSRPQITQAEDVA